MEPKAHWHWHYYKRVLVATQEKFQVLNSGKWDPKTHLQLQFMTKSAIKEKEAEIFGIVPLIVCNLRLIFATSKPGQDKRTAATPNQARGVKFGGQWPFPHFLVPYFQHPFSDCTHLHHLGLYFDFNFIPVKFCDCILHNCDSYLGYKICPQKYKHTA